MKRLKFSGRALLSFASFNLGWWACALGPAHGYIWLGPLLAAALTALHLYMSPTPLGEALFLTALAAFGFAFDTLLILGGVFKIIPATAFAPMWLVCMWVLLGLTFESMLVMRRNRYLLSFAGLMSGPISYLFAEAVDILDYANPTWASVAIHALIWALLMPFLFRLRDLMIRLGLNRDHRRSGSV